MSLSEVSQSGSNDESDIMAALVPTIKSKLRISKYAQQWQLPTFKRKARSSENVRSLPNVRAIKFQLRISDNVQQECSSQYSMYVKYNTVTEVQVTEVGYLQLTRRTKNPSLHIVCGSAISSNVVKGTLLLKESKPIRESHIRHCCWSGRSLK